MHVEKYTRTAVGHILQHYNRWVMNFSNKDIDHEKTDLNYNLAPERDLSDIDYYRSRLAQVKCQNRADVKTLCDWIVTLPKKSFTEAQEQQFFQSAYDLMASRYGEKNVVSAWVHKDEAGQPHLHFCFIPVCRDKKKDIEKVSAKEVLTRTDLKTIHTDMSRHLEREFGYDVGILNGATENGNMTVNTLKLKELQAEVKETEQVSKQTVQELAKTIRRKPQIIALITKAIRLAMGDKDIQHDKQQQRLQERSR